MFAAIVGVLAAVMPIARTWPQAIRIIRRKDASGVSVTTWALILANFTIWTIYGLYLQLPALIIANIGAGTGAICILISLSVHANANPFIAIATIATSTAITLGLHALGGDETVWAAASTLAVVMFLPQVRTAFRSNPSGISPTTWWLGIVAGLVWASYGWSVGQLQIAAPHLVMTPCAIAILWRIYTFKIENEPTRLTTPGYERT